MREHVYDYLCVLDPGCGRGGHSLHCKELNKKREAALLAQEREWRMAQVLKDINAPAHEDGGDQ